MRCRRRSAVRPQFEHYSCLLRQRGVQLVNGTKSAMPPTIVLPCFLAANERTFLHWMNMSVTTGSISAALLGEPPPPAPGQKAQGWANACLTA